MENLKQKIREDLANAIRGSEEISRSTLRLLSAAILNKEKEKRYKISKGKPDLAEEELVKEAGLTDGEIIEVISSEAKKRKESILEFEKGGRLQPTLHPARKKHIFDLVKKEKAELKILEKYLPEQLSEEDLKKIVKETIDKLGAKEIRDVGRVMGEIMPKVKGRTDGTTVSKVVKDLL